MNYTKKSPHFILILLIAFLHLNSATAEAPTLIDSDFEKVSGETWPKGWNKTEESSWETEGGNSFIRILCSEPGKMIMLYREINIPAGTKSLELSWKERVTGLVRGENSWFDARIMMEFLNTDRETVTPKPPTPNTGKDTNGWVEKKITFPVPEEATILKLMPTLFRVTEGSFDIDDMVLTPISTN